MLKDTHRSNSQLYSHIVYSGDGLPATTPTSHNEFHSNVLVTENF